MWTDIFSEVIRKRREQEKLCQEDEELYLAG